MSVSFSARVAARGFDVSFELADGETLAVLGPNGAGKSTLVGLLAGLVRPDSGRAVLDGTVLFDVPKRSDGRRAVPSRASALPPHRRGIALLAQEALLFPHLSVLDNVAFGPRSSGVGRRAAAARAIEWLAAVEAAGLADRRPAELSGGQAQRVALARALAPDPALLLLDEPMAALDVTVAPHLRRLLRDVLAARSTIVVTHEVLDAFVLADRVLVLAGGRVVEHGPTREVLERPRTAFTAELTGLNIVAGTRTDAGLVTAGGVELRAGATGGSALGSAIGTAVIAAFHPSAVAVSPVSPGAPSPAAGVLRAVVTDLEPRGDTVRIRSALAAAEVPAARAADLGATPGDTLDFEPDPRALTVYPA